MKEGRKKEGEERIMSLNPIVAVAVAVAVVGVVVVPIPLPLHTYVHTYLYSLFSFLLTSCMKYRFLQTTRAHIQTKYAATIYNIQLYNPILLELHSGDICCIS